MVQIELNGHKAQLPTSWGEMTVEHFRRTAFVLALPQTPANQYQILRLLTPTIPPQLYLNLEDDQLTELVALLDWMKTPGTIRRIPLFRRWFRNYWLPDRETLVHAEMAIGEKYLKAFIQTGEEKYLNLLTACLVRPTKWWIVLFPFVRWFNLGWNGDIRERFHSQIQERRARQFRNLPVHIRLATVWWLIRIRWEIMQAYPDLFRSSKKDGNSKSDFIEVAFAISESQLFGDFESTMRTNANTLLKYLSYKKRTAEAVQQR
jgi:hypothetical protein